MWGSNSEPNQMKYMNKRFVSKEKTSVTLNFELEMPNFSAAETILIENLSGYRFAISLAPRPAH